MAVQEHDEREDKPVAVAPFWKSRSGTYLVVTLVLGGLLLGYEHRIHIFASNWIIWLPLLICVGMHFFMHGGHGGHGGHGPEDDRS